MAERYKIELDVMFEEYPEELESSSERLASWLNKIVDTDGPPLTSRGPNRIRLNKVKLVTNTYVTIQNPMYKPPSDDALKSLRERLTQTTEGI